MQQIIVIHGGTTFSSYEKYVDDLRQKTVHIERLQPAQTWKDSLQTELGDKYQVLLPSMPNKTNAQYNEWKIWFDRIAEVASDECIVVGHSLGGIFLAKYLSENTFPKKIKATILIAAPFDDETAEDLTDFKIQHLTTRFTQQAGKIIFINGADDPVIPINELDKYKHELPNAEYIILPAPDHFVRPKFPELVRKLHELV